MKREPVSRFTALKIPEYDGERSTKVERREGKSKEYSERVSKLSVLSGHRGVRDAVEMPRITNTSEEAEKAITTWKKYRNCCSPSLEASCFGPMLPKVGVEGEESLTFHGSVAPLYSNTR
ncbi:hypothetical protein HS1genome_1757 [Sulfodiicoccus acidiphilus]|uniref:Uncharacterized protein n=1 Tax=Sulfodiicoccus acidiphilus TaxID=1670455 RepID=A0A348B5B6_9CREN|nr:hypothetical protein [Sulfodiicoccus acidiphilus]BBD73368.1 hypothetical protein HS1genome_1757 [Sulfodiicoccus acidiphilus]GGU00965.1 hypothetical protein GCM10007116_17770 [Sulfodiicoccus acidiphilus]